MKTFFVSAVLVAMVEAGWIYFQPHSSLQPTLKPERITTVPSAPSIETVAITPIIPTGWLTYTDIPYQYEISYPPGWTVSKTPEQGFGGVATLRGNTVRGQAIKMEIGKHIEKLKIGETLKQYEQRRLQGKPMIINHEDDRGLANNLLVHTYVIPLYEGSGYGLYYIFHKNEDVFFAEMYTENPKEDTKLLDQILSTFQFTEVIK